MAQRPNQTESSGKGEESGCAEQDVARAPDTPMEKFRSLARRLIRVPKRELRQEETERRERQSRK
jgi:hypothetical protein